MSLTIIERARRYIRQMDASLQGANGSGAIFAVAVILVRGFNLDHETALLLLREWNELKSVPLWSDRDLVAKLNSAARDGKMACGHLLEDTNHRPRTTGKPLPNVPLSLAPRRGYSAEELDRKAAQQAEWPSLVDLTGRHRGAIGHLRNCPGAPVDILAHCNRLMFDPARPDCFALDDGRSDGRGHRQYRKFAGSVFPHGKKSDNARGSAAKGFFTLSLERRLDPDELIFITEGSISLLEAVALQWLCEGRARRWHFLAAHSAASTFAAEPKLLKAIAGRHCRIMRDPGTVGRDAAKAWRNELFAAGCTVDFPKMPAGFQDLKTILSAGSDGVSAARSILRYPTSSWKAGAG